MTQPKFGLFPDPGNPSNPATWEDIERLSLHYQPAHLAVTLVERGDVTREQALVSLVYWFAAAFSRQFKRETDAMALERLDTIRQEPCGCSHATYVRRRSVLMSCESHRSADAVDPAATNQHKRTTRDDSSSSEPR